MSALGSSVINKSAKKFGPKKAPARRPITDPKSASARPSVDRQTQSQPPHPRQTVHLTAASPAPFFSLPTITSTENRTQTRLAAPSPIDRAVQPSRSSRDITSSSQTSLQLPASATRLTGSHLHVPHLGVSSTQTSGPHAPSLAIKANANAKDADVRDASIRPSVGGSGQSQWSTSPTQQRRALVNPESESQVINNDARPTKRCKVTSSQPENATQQPLARANDPIPTIEIDVEPAEENVQISSASPRTTRHDRATREGIRKSTASTRRASTRRDVQHPDEGVIDVANAPSEQATASGHTLSRAKPRRPRPRNGQRAIEHAAADIVEEAVQGSTRNPRKRGRKSQRAETPADAENLRVAPSETRMAELCRDSGAGRKSLREQELREMDRAAFVKKKQQELQEMMGEAKPPDQAASSEPSQAAGRRQERGVEQEQAVALNVPNTIIVNGQIQIDEESLQIDRHAAAAVERDLEELDPIDENDLSRKITSATWLKRDKSGGWNELLLDRFYQGLRMFGTDFEMISKMFPGKTRHAIKLKFCKEEKLDYPRIKAALLGEKEPVILEEYEKLTGREYEDPEELERLLEEDRQKLEEEHAAEKQAMEEAAREREEQAALERNAASEGSGKESEGRGKKGKSKNVKETQKQRRSQKKRLGPAIRDLQDTVGREGPATIAAVAA